MQVSVFWYLFYCVCVSFPDFTFEYIQREGLRDPIIFDTADGLGIQSVAFLCFLFLVKIHTLSLSYGVMCCSFVSNQIPMKLFFFSFFLGIKINVNIYMDFLFLAECQTPISVWVMSSCLLVSSYFTPFLFKWLCFCTQNACLIERITVFQINW